MGTHHYLNSLKRRTDAQHCCVCRRKFKKHDRVITVFIVANVGHDSGFVMQEGVELWEEYELAHIKCTDPKLVMGGP